MEEDLYTATLRHTKRILAVVVGFTLLVVGIILIFFPGPAMLVIPLALLILGTEFVWARRILKRVKRKFLACNPLGSRKKGS